MDNKINRNSVIFSLFWRVIELGGSQFIGLIVQIILARILTPEDFGTMAILLVFVNIASVFVQGGFNIALIQKKDADNLDFSSILYLSLLVSFFLYSILYFLAPQIALFYVNPNLVPYLRVIGIIFITGAINSVQISYLQKNMKFMISAKSSLIANIISGILGIISAYSSLGIWALIIQQCSFQIINCLLLSWLSDWKPILKFSISRVKKMFLFGGNILISNLISNIYLEVRTLLIGRTYSAGALGYYRRGEQFPNVIVKNVDGAIQSVLLPTLSTYQDAPMMIKKMVRRSLKTSAYIIFPAMLGMAAVSNNLIIFLLGEQWIPSIPFLVVFALTYAIWPIITINLQPMRAVGRSDLIVKTEIVKKSIGAIIILITIQINVFAVAIGFLIERYIEIIINAFPNRSLINYPLWEQIKDISISLLQSIIMSVAVFSINFLDLANGLELTLQIIIGIVVYILLSLILKNETFFYLFNIAKSMKRN